MSKEGESSTKKLDDYDAVRTIVDTLQGFTNEDQERILRWAKEKVGLNAQIPPSISSSPVAPVVATMPTSHVPKTIKAFVDEKNPQSDVQLATAIAYFYRFEAPPEQRKEQIDATLLRDACRLAGRPGKLTQPLKTLSNAHAGGLLDRGSERGTFVINSVGENLVGMILPSSSAGQAQSPRKAGARGKKKAKKRR